MGRAEERLDVDLEAEDRVPQQVEDAGEHEQDRTQERDPIRRREDLAHRDAPRLAEDGDQAQHDPEGRGARIEEGVPRREERVVDHAVLVRPEVDVEAADQPDRQSCEDPIEAQAGPRGGNRAVVTITRLSGAVSMDNTGRLESLSAPRITRYHPPVAGTGRGTVLGRLSVTRGARNDGRRRLHRDSGGPRERRFSARGQGRGKGAGPNDEPEPHDLLGELSKAMHAAAESQHVRIAEELQRHRATQVKAIKARATSESAELKKVSQQEAGEIDAWAAAATQLIATERAQKIDAQRETLEAELLRQEVIAERKVLAVEAAVLAHQTELDTFFSQLQRETDPVEIARLASSLPSFPSLSEAANAAMRQAAAEYAPARRPAAFTLDTEFAPPYVPRRRACRPPEVTASRRPAAVVEEAERPPPKSAAAVAEAQSSRPKSAGSVVPTNETPQNYIEADEPSPGLVRPAEPTAAVAGCVEATAAGADRRRMTVTRTRRFAARVTRPRILEPRAPMDPESPGHGRHRAPSRSMQETTQALQERTTRPLPERTTPRQPGRTTRPTRTSPTRPKRRRRLRPRPCFTPSRRLDRWVCNACSIESPTTKPAGRTKSIRSGRT